MSSALLYGSILCSAILMAWLWPAGVATNLESGAGAGSAAPVEHGDIEAAPPEPSGAEYLCRWGAPLEKR
jgi:hypothetical protein